MKKAKELHARLGEEDLVTEVFDGKRWRNAVLPKRAKVIGQVLL